MAILTMIYFKKLKPYRHGSTKDPNVLQSLSISGNIENGSTTATTVLQVLKELMCLCVVLESVSSCKEHHKCVTRLPGKI